MSKCDLLATVTGKFESLAAAALTGLLAARRRTGRAATYDSRLLHRPGQGGRGPGRRPGAPAAGVTVTVAAVTVTGPPAGTVTSHRRRRPGPGQ